MPSFPHEILVDLFRRDPTLVRELLPPELPLPAWTRVDTPSERINELQPSERHADLVLEPDQGPILILEVQRGMDPEKLFAWPFYGVGLRARRRREVVVVVITLSARTARWAARPVSLGGGNRWRPAVIGPAQIPRIKDPQRAERHPELALLSVMAHGREPDALEMATAALQGAAALDEDRTRIYVDLIFESIAPSVRSALESLMEQPYEPRSAFVRRLLQQGRQEGILEGRQEGRQEGAIAALRAALLEILLARGFDLPPEEARRVEEAADAEQLTRWLRRAAVATRLEEVFGD